MRSRGQASRAGGGKAWRAAVREGGQGVGREGADRLDAREALRSGKAQVGVVSSCSQLHPRDTSVDYRGDVWITVVMCGSLGMHRNQDSVSDEYWAF